MAISLTINGISYQYPEPGENDWGLAATNWAVAVTSGMLQKAGGLFTLLGEVDFGATYGLKSKYYKTRSSNVASAGEFRLARTDGIYWRNNANSANGVLSTDTSDNLTWNGNALLSNFVFNDSATIDFTYTTGVATGVIQTNSITNTYINSAAAIAYSKLNLSGSIVNADINSSAAIAYSKLNLSNSIVNADINTSAAIAYSKLALTGSILNADVNASAAIAYSKLAALTANRVLLSDGTGFVSASSVTNTTLGYLDATSSIQTQINSKLNLSGGTLTGNLVLNADPTVPLGAVTKQYADALIQGLSFKNAVLAGTVVNGTLATAYASGQTIDGVVLNTGDRILIKNQTTQSENGIYIVNASGAPTRSSDADTWNELVSAFVFVETGSSNADTGWVCNVDPGGTLGTTAVTWTQFSSAGAITADGLGLNLSGGVMSLTLDGTTLSKSPTGLKVSDLGILNAQINAGAAIAYSKLNLSGSIVNADINASAAIAYSKLNLTTSIVNGDINASAAIALTKLAATTASRALVTDVSGLIVPATTTATEIGYVNGVTSGIQSQFTSTAASIALKGALAGNNVWTNDNVIDNAKTIQFRELTSNGTNKVSMKAPDSLAADTNFVLPPTNGTNLQVLTTNGSGTTTWVDSPNAPAVTTPGAYPYSGANNQIILVDTSSARTINLPSPVLNTRITVKDAVGSAQTNNITVVRAGSEQIEGIAASKILQTNWGCWTFITDGTNWFIC